MFFNFRKCVNIITLTVRKSHSIKRFTHRKTDLTKVTYNVQRQNFNELQQKHIDFFRKLLGEHRAVMGVSNLEKYNEDWINNLKGSSAIVLKPKSTEEVSHILSFCNDNNLAVCPQGGNTGLVGGQLPVFDEIVISTELMNEIISLDDNSGVVVCQAGCVLESIDNILAEKGLMVPLDLGAKGSCHIGGNVSTNAGGLRLLRYGNLHGNVLGLEVVKANGEILDCLSTLKKDNTGYHLKHLFIGSEGTLGFVTKVAMQCPPRSKHTNVAFLGTQNFGKVLKTFKKAKQDLGEILSAVEVIDSSTMEFIDEKLNIKSPIGEYPFYLLIETSGSNESHDTEKLNTFLETALNKHFILNGIVASEPAKINTIWSIREKIPEGFKLCGAVFCYDVSLPLEHYFTLVDDMNIYMGNLSEKVFGFGHLGDGNLHLQIEMKEFSKEVKDHIEPYIFKRIKDLGGSISAEHGMGFLKAPYLDIARPQSAIKLMRDLKILFDPKGILNPYKVLPWRIF
ncbi:D-2-hydroxyglutarate dehydrogenase, mitochondrial [Anoplophora glabripennis]|nr:D-2-hydroxyglutarate dehydrogenase, mitochondrial [Anoplophora glabripennis]